MHRLSMEQVFVLTYIQAIIIGTIAALIGYKISEYDNNKKDKDEEEKE